jgi:hypothetical protein
MQPTKKELILAGLVFLALPFLGEVALRVAHLQFDAQLYGPNRGRGWILRPGASGLVSTETRQFVRISSRGFHAVGEIRIAHDGGFAEHDDSIGPLRFHPVDGKNCGVLIIPGAKKGAAKNRL